MVAHAISLGSDPRTLTEALVGYLRNGFLSLMAPELVQLPSGRLDGLAEQAQRLGAAGLVRGIEVLGASLTEMRHAPDPRVLLDIATVQLTADSVATDTAALLGRIERLERQVAEGAVASAAPAAVTRAAPVDPSTGRAALGGRARQPAPAAAGGRAGGTGQPGTGQPATGRHGAGRHGSRDGGLRCRSDGFPVDIVGADVDHRGRLGTHGPAGAAGDAARSTHRPRSWRAARRR